MILGVVWYVLVGVLIAGYALLDGFDLGVGILYPFIARSDNERAALRTSIGPVWDGNEVWLLTAGGALFAAFPAVYATVFSGFYLAMMLVLFCLIFRAVSLEYGGKSGRSRGWDLAFFLGSAVAALLLFLHQASRQGADGFLQRGFQGGIFFQVQDDLDVPLAQAGREQMDG